MQPGPSGRSSISACISGPKFFEVAVDATIAGPCPNLPSGDGGSVGGIGNTATEAQNWRRQLSFTRRGDGDPLGAGRSGRARQQTLGGHREVRHGLSRQADHGHAPERPACGTRDVPNGRKSSATKSPAPLVGTASGADGAESVYGGARAFPCTTAKQIKKVSFAGQPMIVLITGSTSDEYTFDNQNADGTPRVSQTSIRRKKTRRGRKCPIEEEILAHALATDLLRATDHSFQWKVSRVPHGLILGQRLLRG